MMNRIKRLMAILITLIMVFNALPVSAFAALAEGGNENGGNGGVVEEVPVDAEEVPVDAEEETVEEEIIDYSGAQMLPRPVLMEGDGSQLYAYASNGNDGYEAKAVNVIFSGTDTAANESVTSAKYYALAKITKDNVDYYRYIKISDLNGTTTFPADQWTSAKDSNDQNFTIDGLSAAVPCTISLIASKTSDDLQDNDIKNKNYNTISTDAYFGVY